MRNLKVREVEHARETGKFQDSSDSLGISVQWGQARGVTTGHFTGIMGWESLAAGAGRMGFTGRFSRGHRDWQDTIIFKPIIGDKNIFRKHGGPIDIYLAFNLKGTLIYIKHITTHKKPASLYLIMCFHS